MSASERPGCASPQELEAFALGDLPELELEEIAAHLHDCDLCRAALEMLEAEDELIADLRGLSPQSAESGSVGSSVPGELLHRARAAFPSGAEAALGADAGVRLASRLEQGPVRLDQFELQEEIGVGSFGHVFRALDTQQDCIVAIKVQRGGGEQQGEEQRRFLREARSVAQPEHPGLVKLHGTGRTPDGAHYLVCEYVAGDTLERRYRADPPTPRETAEWMAQIAEALQYAHEHGVIHRDLKPSNVLIDPSGRTHVLDFGLAKLEAESGSMTLDGQVMGTPAYMSPEQARGDSHHVDARTDVYSIGVMLYEALTGTAPFQGNRRMLLLQVLEDEPRAPRRLDENVPRDLETVCLKAMAKRPADRYASASLLAADLRRFLARESIQARPLSRVTRLRRWSRRYPLAAGVVAAVVLGSGAGWIYLANLADSLVRRSARHSAGLQAAMLEEINDYYSDLVDGLDQGVVEVTHEYASRENALPLPATFTITAGERIARLESGLLVRLYSDYPWPWRTDGGPRDDFEREALTALRADPLTPVWEFGDYLGKPSLRYAQARRMQESCLGCHNVSDQSPKRDWRVGDVRGVLEIIRPLASDLETTRRGLRGTFVLATATTSILLLVAGGVLLTAGGRRRRGAHRGV